MCGIFGSPNISPSVARMLPFLGLEMESRGKDAWGASNGDEIIKHLGMISETWHEEDSRFAAWQAGIFHTRGASQGSPKDIENAHPFEFLKPDGDRLIGIHNGCLNNHAELNTLHNRQFEVDSQHIFANMVEGLPMNELSGWGNLAWWETSPNGRRRINLARFNSNNLEVVELKNGEMLFCSTYLPLAQVARLFGNPIASSFNLAEGVQYWFDVDTEGIMQLWRGESMGFKFWTPTRPANYNVYTHNTSYASSTYSNVYRPQLPAAPAPEPTAQVQECFICASEIEGNRMMCDVCLATMASEFAAEHARKAAEISATVTVN